MLQMLQAGWANSGPRPNSSTLTGPIDPIDGSRDVQVPVGICVLRCLTMVFSGQVLGTSLRSASAKRSPLK